MEFRQMVEDKFNLLKNSITEAARVVRDCEDKQSIDTVSKNIVKHLYAIKKIAKDIDSRKAYGNSVHEEITSLEIQLKDQQDMIKSLEKYQNP